MVVMVEPGAQRRTDLLFDELNSRYVGRWLPGALTSADCREDRRDAKQPLTLPVRRLQFSPREDEVLRLVASGRRDKEIARLLGIAPSTVRTHLENIFEKCGERSRAAAVARWLVGRADRF
jgi:DNA-binding CsgD family transcriptional regulator